MRPILFAAYLTGLSLCLVSAQTVPASAQNRDVRGCLSIVDVNERVDCLEGRTPAPVPSPTAPTSVYTPRQTQRRVAPSFDCGAARTSIERAICSDAELSEWDGRMGQAFRQALRLRKDGQALLENQRRWIIQRERACGSNSEILFSCLLEITKQRVAVLSEEVRTATSAGPQPPLSLAPPQASPSSSVPADSQPLAPAPKPITLTPPAPQAIPGGATSQQENKQSSALTSQTSPQASNPPTSAQDQGTNPVIVLLGIGMALWLGVKVVRDIQRRQLRQNLIAKYGEEEAERILAGDVWQGMTDEQLVYSWGSPVEVGREIVRNKSKETWKYGQTGKNRFSNRVYLENGIVIGWKN